MSHRRNSVGKVIRSVPKHDYVYIKRGIFWIRIREEQLRALCLAVAKGELNPGIKIMYEDETVAVIQPDGRLEPKPTGNILRLNSDLHMELLNVWADKKTKRNPDETE